MTGISKFLKLFIDTKDSKIDLTEKVLYFHGYSFVFRDQRGEPREPYITGKFSSKFSSAGFWRRIVKESIKDLEKLKSLNDINFDNTKFDFLFGGSLKTLLPAIKFGGNEVLFDVWMFVRTPEGYMFPAKFYYGQSGTSLGGWETIEAKKVFPSDFFSIINFSPFNFTPDELDGFIEALEISLKMVPVADYYGVYLGDYGYTIMGVKDGKPYLMDLGQSYNESRIEEYLKRAQSLR